MLGIENGLALNHDISNVRYFARRGVVYITLCHNGDNDICDSARGCNTHGGVSRFGEQVIKEMNRCGIMVDLSHAGEKSFYDALSISSKPIVCSHSNCKALCDVPRNLTDDQLRALAKHGGVAHITLYHGFLRNDSQEATVMDAIAHLEHAISIMGIEHVGLGTDFDGDGGIRGWQTRQSLSTSPCIFCAAGTASATSPASGAATGSGLWLRCRIICNRQVCDRLAAEFVFISNNHLKYFSPRLVRRRGDTNMRIITKMLMLALIIAMASCGATRRRLLMPIWLRSSRLVLRLMPIRPMLTARLSVISDRAR